MTTPHPKIEFMAQDSKLAKIQLEYEHKERMKKLEDRQEFIMTCFKGGSLAIIALGIMISFGYVLCKDIGAIDKFLPIITAILGYIGGRKFES